MAMPIWVYFIVAGIIISALMAFRTGKTERKQEMESIELEGKVYMDRIEKERKVKDQAEA
ncbi:sporulation YhaL family protein [Cytobacillus sp. Hz8]|uniref:sporulation YhaL family protein n=1 Tax=Cytobacillus sp. Hz8 TaxID=3347168 RepID=UPI0035DCBFD1